MVLDRDAEEVEACCVNALTQNTLCHGQLETVALQDAESHEKESKSRAQRVDVSVKKRGFRKANEMPSRGETEKRTPSKNNV